jgi:hypothetical protein
MNMPVSAAELSRIDKLFLDRNATALDDSLRRRKSRGLDLLVGDDVRASYGLQLALLTATNLGRKCFASPPMAQAAPDVWSARCLVPVARATTLGEAVAEFGGEPISLAGRPPDGRHVVLGGVTAGKGAVRATYDGWCISVGPSAELPRMAERDFCPIAGMAAAAVALGEVFAEFAGISVTAARRVVRLSLWRPDLAGDDPRALGVQLAEFPLAIAVFGLGHLGQAYLWGLGALPYAQRADAEFLLCDDDHVESGNVETGALLTDVDTGKLKTRVAARWLETRGFSTRLIERRVDVNFRRTGKEPVIALSGFDNNWPRHWLSGARFNAIFDSGLGGEANNFDTIGYHAWPNPRSAEELWRIESETELAVRQQRKEQQIAANAAYGAIAADTCGRLLLADKAVAVPFVGALAASIALAEMLKAVNGGPTFSDLKARVCSLGNSQLEGRLANEVAPPLAGVATQSIS